MLLKYVHSSPLGADHMLGFLGKGHLLQISQALLAMSSIGKTLWREVHDVESQVLYLLPSNRQPFCWKGWGSYRVVESQGGKGR